MLAEAIVEFIQSLGFFSLTWQEGVMLIIGCVLLYLAIVKEYEPLLLLPIAFGVILSNIPLAGLMDPPGPDGTPGGLLYYLYQGVKLGIYPPLIFMGIGAMTDFGPLLANPKTLLLGAAAQLGIFTTLLGALLLGFTPAQAGAIGIIGGADGPTAIYTATILAPELLGPIAIAAYSYMALVPIIQPPIMMALTTKKNGEIVMEQLRSVSKTEKILFPIIVTILISLFLPDATPLIGSLMLGNLLRESGVVERLSKTAQNELINIITIFLGLTVGASAKAETFLTWQTIFIILLGLAAFAGGTAAGILMGKLMCKLTGGKVNPSSVLRVSAVPWLPGESGCWPKANPQNFLLMHAIILMARCG